MNNPLKNTRNIGIIAHIDAGKTTTTERILFYTGKTYKIGDIDEGTTVMDWMPQERERGITITAAATTTFWTPTYRGELPEFKYRINIIDTPGHVDFTAEVERSLRILDGALVIFDGVQGVEPQSETVWRQADKYKVPRICFINKLDRLGANFEYSLNSIREKLNKNAAALTIPIGLEAKFSGIIDLLQEKAVYFEGENGEKLNFQEIPTDYKNLAKKYREELVEKIVENDDSLTSKYLGGKKIEVEDLRKALRKEVLNYKIIPVLCGSSLKNKGVQIVLDAVCEYLPSPLDLPPVLGVNPETKKEESREAKDDSPLAGLVFKLASDPFIGHLSYLRVYSGILKKGTYVLNSTRFHQERIARLVRMHANQREEVSLLRAGDIGAIVGLKDTKTGDTLCDPDHPIILEKIRFPEPVISIKIEPKTKADQEKLALALKKLSDEDPTFKTKYNQETGDTLISGMGELHLDIIVDRMKREFSLNAKVGRPQVAYKETITKKVEAQEGKYIRQTGGRGQYGHVIISLEPLKRGKGFEFVNAIKGGIIPSEFIPAVEKGIKEAMDKGVLAGYPINDVRVTLYDGSFHEVDSSEIAFKIAGSIAFQEGAKRAGLSLLEPIMRLEVLLPPQFFGEVTGDLNSRRGKILNITERAGLKVIDAQVPLAEMFGYATHLRSISEGRGTFTMEFAHYDFVPQGIAQEIVEGRVKAKQEARR